MSEVKDSLDIDVKQNFIDPLQGVAEKDIRDIQVESKRWYASARTCQALTNECRSLCVICSNKKRSINCPDTEQWNCM